MKRLIVLMTALALAGCATTTDATTAPVAAPEVAIAPTRNAQLADAMSRELAHLARFDPDAVDQVSPELRALATAIMALNAPGEDAALPVMPAPSSADLPPPPADMVSAPSLQHGIHLASYRRLETARRGWEELLAEHGDVLSGLHARLSDADISGQGHYLRLKAGPFDNADSARAVCQHLMATGEYCVVVDFSGQRMADMASITGE